MATIYRGMTVTFAVTDTRLRVCSREATVFFLRFSQQNLESIPRTDDAERPAGLIDDRNTLQNVFPHHRSDIKQRAVRTARGDLARHDAVHPGRAIRAYAATDLADNVGFRQNADHVAVIANDDKIGMRPGHQAGCFPDRGRPFDHGKTLACRGSIRSTNIYPTLAV